MAMADSNMLYVYLAATHRLMLIKPDTAVRALYKPLSRSSAYCEDSLPGPITKTKPSLSATSDDARFKRSGMRRLLLTALRREQSVKP